MAWKINDTVVHVREGVCTITAIQEMSLSSDGPREYYVLAPVYDAGGKIYVPSDLAQKMLRDLITKEAIDQLVTDLPSLGIDWISDEKVRQKSLQEDVRSGDHETLLGLISTLYQKREEIGQTGKKFHSSDEHFLNEAEKQINREFGYVLGISPDEVPDYIGNKIKK